MQNFIRIFHSFQEIGLFSLFQNLALGKASTKDKCHFAISWTRCRQYQCVRKILSKYSKRLKVIDIFHEQVSDKIFTNCPVTKSNVVCRTLYESQPSVSVDFLRVVQFRLILQNYELNEPKRWVDLCGRSELRRLRIPGINAMVSLG